MKHVSEILDRELRRLAVVDSECGEDASSADPFIFDVVCRQCGCVFDNREPWCPQCENIRTGGLPVGW